MSTDLEESLYLTTVPLARDGGMTIWVLVDGRLPPNSRRILCSCESFRKRSLIGDSTGHVDETIVHGIASVFCKPEYRSRGYAGRMMRDLALTLRYWQSARGICSGSMLYSDIGKKYYAKLGWKPVTNNSHLEFSPSTMYRSSLAREILIEDLEALCKKDESLIRTSLATQSFGSTKQLVIIPDHDHMLWHISKEEFACEKIFDALPSTKGAVAGPVGDRVWVIWTHRYYDDPTSSDPHNTLYILRLVFENPDAAKGTSKKHGRTEKQMSRLMQMLYLRAVILSARVEASDWGLDSVNLWDPPSFVRKLLEDAFVEFEVVERESESIASALWYGDNDIETPDVRLLSNEHYAWC